MPAEPNPVPHSVFIPFYGRLDQVSRCLDSLLSQRLKNTRILLVNDGSPETEVEETLGQYLTLPGVVLLHHDGNRGVAAARNTAVNWCRVQALEILIMLDSDCLVDEDFISGHLALHREYPQAAAFGGGVRGSGASIWATLDKIVSWVHSVPYGAVRKINTPYHLPTTNFSVKISMLPVGEQVFDERLNTGEDALLVRRLRQEGKTVWFSPSPTIIHKDRETLLDLLRHHYPWGHHQYFVQLTGDLNPIGFNPWFRLLFLILFIPALPLFALMGSTLNLMPWLKHKPIYALAFPAVYLLWLCKSVAVVEAALRPEHCLRMD